MPDIPAQPKIFHITHLDNLARIASAGCLWSDAGRIANGQDCALIGMSTIKRRRLEELEVACHPGTKVGEYVPFYFCPRSIMLYILHMGNHPELDYRQGQRLIVHLQADLPASIRWAEQHGIRWAFSDRNADGYLAEFYNSADDLGRINWNAVRATDFRDMVVKEGKQAEFLIHGAFPWPLIEKVGAMDGSIAQQAANALANQAHRPVVHVERSWYF
jgi:hypothetical protein